MKIGQRQFAQEFQKNSINTMTEKDSREKNGQKFKKIS